MRRASSARIIALRKSLKAARKSLDNPWKPTGQSPYAWRAYGSARKDAGLLSSELLLGQHALVLQRGELLELLDATLSVAAGLSRRWRRCVFLLGIRLLRAPSLSLATAHAVRHCGRRAGDNCGAGHPAKQSWHWVVLSIRTQPRRRRGRRSGPALGCAG